MSGAIVRSNAARHEPPLLITAPSIVPPSLQRLRDARCINFALVVLIELGRTPRADTGAASLLVLARMFNPIDHQHVHEVPSILQPESQLFPNGSGKGCSTCVISLRCF